MKKNRKDKNRLEKIPREYLALGVFLLLAVLLAGRVFLLQMTGTESSWREIRR